MSALPTLLVALIIAAFVGFYVVMPLVSRQQTTRRQSPGNEALDQLRLQADLLAERHEVYAALRELDFDYKTNKVAQDDYAAQRYQLVARGVEILETLDALPSTNGTAPVDPVEAAITAYRGGTPLQASVQATASEHVHTGDEQLGGFCPQCGQPVSVDDHFCGSCGAALQ